MAMPCSLIVIKEICGLVSGPVSAEVTATDHKAMMMEAEKLLNLAGNVTIGRRCTIGMGSTIYIGVEIPDDKVENNGENVN